MLNNLVYVFNDLFDNPCGRKINALLLYLKSTNARIITNKALRSNIISK